jgi:hypothetical protein
VAHHAQLAQREGGEDAEDVEVQELVDVGAVDGQEQSGDQREGDDAVAVGEAVTAVA